MPWRILYTRLDNTHIYGVRKHAERTRFSREQYPPQKISKWKYGGDRHNTSRQSQYQSKRWSSGISHTEYPTRYSPPNSQLPTRSRNSDNQPEIYEYSHGQPTNKTPGNVQPKVENHSLPSVGTLPRPQLTPVCNLTTLLLRKNTPQTRTT